MLHHENRGSLRKYRAEFHVHTVLSPCALVEMIPPLIIQEAASKNINILAITDHNSMLNVPAVMKAAEGTEITVLPGMELHTREEVHILCIFETLQQAAEFQTIVDLNYSPGTNDTDIFGPQYVVDHTGEFVRSEEHILSQATRLSIDDAWKHVHQLGGLFIPSHIQRQVYGILPTLGFLPENIRFDGLEISRNISFEMAVRENPSIQNYPFIRNGDAHDLQAIAGLNIITALKPTLHEIKLALQNIDGRSIETPHEMA